MKILSMLLGQRRELSSNDVRSHTPHSTLPALAFALILVPIVGHGCHGDDIDREPSFAPIHHSSEGRP